MAARVDHFGSGGLRAPSGERVAAVVGAFVRSLPMPPPAPLVRHGPAAAASDRSPLAAPHALPERSAAEVARHVGLRFLYGAQLAAFAHQCAGRDAFATCMPADGRSFWSHALATAAVADVLMAESQPSHDAAEVIAAAMLHDVGKAVLAACLPRSYARVMRHAQDARLPVWRAECNVLGVDHPAAGAQLAEHWGLPSCVRDVIRLHHHPPAASDSHASLPAVRTVLLVSLANALAHDERFGHPQRASREFIAQLTDGLGIDSGRIPALRRQADRRRAALMESLADGLALASGGAASATQPPITEGGAAVAKHFASCVHGFVTHLRTGGDEQSLIGDVVKALTSVLACNTGVGFLLSQAGGACYCAVCEGGVVRDETFLGEDAVPREDVYVGSPVAAFISPPPVARLVVERFAALFTDEQQLMWPLVAEGSLVGGVVVDASCAQGWGPHMAREDHETLAALLELAVTSCVTRRRLQASEAELSRAAAEADSVPQRRIHSRALDMVAAMAAGAGHELNSPLAVISGRAQILRHRAADDDTRNALDIIQTNAQRCSDMVGALLAFARPSPPSPRPIDLVVELNDILATWYHDQPEFDGQIELDVALDARRVVADPEHLTTIFRALADNALHAAAPGLRLIINSRFDPSDETVVIAVADNGCGMTEEVLRHACDPFFSHREAGRGRGLGAATAKRLAEINGGDLWYESAPARGTTAYVRLPALR